MAVNVHNAIKAAERVVELGAIPYNPLQTHFYDVVSPHPWEYWIEQDEYYVSISDAVLRIEGESKGADKEVAQAMEAGIPVFRDYEELENYLKWG